MQPQSKKEHIIQRLLEILPGFFSWNVILFPYWGIFLVPNLVAYFVLGFNIYWFYQSLTIAVTSTISHWRIQASMIFDWEGELKHFPDWEKVNNIVVITTYKEPLHTLERTLNSLKNQTLPKNQITVVLAMEKKEDEKERLEKVKYLKDKFGKVFKNLFVTVHELIPGEVVGKASNERYAAMWVKKELVDIRGNDINYITITSCDADHVYHPKHFACLTYKFLDNPKRYNFFWQPAIMFYNNIWDIPAITRVPNTLGSIWNLSQLPRKDRLINQQNYGLSLKLLDEAGYWDPDKIPEDWGIFFKAFFAKGGDVEVEPIYLPLFADAAQSHTLRETLKNQYEQYKRWAWGVSDIPWIIKNFFLAKKVSFPNKIMRLMNVVWAHFMWPVNWFVITVGLTLPTILNPAFGRTTLGYMVPKLSSFILTVSLAFLLVMIIFDNIYKPKRPKDFPLWRAILVPFEYILMPVAGFFLSALPGLDAHTRLMLGKYLEYRVTEKV
ncbi:MAG TPA: glycosyltransferase family 2 protein [Patescibacteria group bacterium]|nr:glycosyltransferase family 2 protein [Patescibacteria group bacterium]